MLQPLQGLVPLSERFTIQSSTAPSELSSCASAAVNRAASIRSFVFRCRSPSWQHRKLNSQAAVPLSHQSSCPKVKPSAHRCSRRAGSSSGRSPVSVHGKASNSGASSKVEVVQPCMAVSRCTPNRVSTSAQRRTTPGHCSGARGGVTQRRSLLRRPRHARSAPPHSSPSAPGSPRRCAVPSGWSAVCRPGRPGRGGLRQCQAN